MSSQLRFVAVLVALFLPTLFTGCGGRQAVPDQSAVAEAGPDQAAWPRQLPVDTRQPWESVDEWGFVDSGALKGVAAINADSEFVTGVERYLEGGDVEDYGEATALRSTPDTLSYAIYRIPLGGDEPGIISVDVNTAAGAGYYIGLGDYARRSWEWHGPFRDNHIRFDVADTSAGPDFTSGMGSVFVCIVAHDGASCDVVGVAVDRADTEDDTAPDAPGAPTATPVSGGLRLEWLPVAAGDLAGYRIYHSSQWFYDGRGAGVRAEDSLEGLTNHLLTGLSGRTYVRIAAVDTSGNESPLSNIIDASPLGDGASPVTVSVSSPSGSLGELISISATGAELYNFDTDGDGTYDITDDASGSAVVDTTRLGIIRPTVRGRSADGTSYARGGVSVLIAGNSRPVASATATPLLGAAPLAITFDGSESTDFDGEIVGGGWDFEGDGTFDVWNDTDVAYVTEASHTYETPGIYSAKLRVVDNEGAWDVDTVAILVEHVNQAPVAHFELTGPNMEPSIGVIPHQVTLDPAGSTDPDGEILKYEWDLEGDGHIDLTYTTARKVNHIYRKELPGRPTLYVTDNQGAIGSFKGQVYARTWRAEAGGPGHTGESLVYGPQDDSYLFSYGWNRISTGSPVYNSNGTILFGDNLGNLHAVPWAGPGWDIDLGSSISGRGPVLDSEGNIYVCDSASNLHKLSKDGVQIYSVSLGATTNVAPLIDEQEQMVYCLTNTGQLQARHIGNGSLQWTFSTGTFASFSGLTLAEGIVVFGDDAGQLHFIYPGGNEFFPPYSSGAQILGTAANTGYETVVCTNYDGAAGGGEVFCVSYIDGSELWSATLGGFISGSPALNTQTPVNPSGEVYVCTESSQLYALSLEDGSELWDSPFVADASIPYCRPVVGFPRLIYFGDSAGKVYCVDATDRSLLWSHGGFGTSFRNTPLIVSGDTLVMLDDSAALFFFKD